MAVANLHETLLNLTLRINRLNLDIAGYQAQKTLALSAQADSQSLKNAEERAIRNTYKELYADNPELAEKYKDYTEIPDFEAEIDKITAKYTDELAELTAWENAINAQITTASAELEEAKVYKESYKAMLSSNIQEDFNYGLG